MNKYMFHEHSKRAYHGYQVEDKYFKVADKFILVNNTEFKYEIPYNGPFEITQCWTNGTVALQCGAKQKRIIYAILSHIHMIQMLKILTLETNDL